MSCPQRADMFSAVLGAENYWVARPKAMRISSVHVRQGKSRDAGSTQDIMSDGRMNEESP